MEYHQKIGLSGAVRSTDVMYVKWDTCQLKRASEVDFAGRLAGTTRGIPGANNDKTINNLL